MNQPRVAITGGFTGGHLFPGLAVAQELRRRHPDAHLLFLGSRGGLEETVLPRHPYDFALLPCVKGAGGSRWQRLRRLPMQAARLFHAAVQAKRALIDNDIQLVVGTGGHASAAALLGASMIGLPSLLLEQNALPGRTNRLLSRFASEVHVQFVAAADGFPDRIPVRWSGNPIRRQLMSAQAVRSQPRRSGLQSKRGTGTCLLVLGGSQGARALNHAVINHLPDLKRRVPDLHLIHLTGPADAAGVRRAMADAGVSGKVAEFCDDMAPLYAAADLVLCRAGATTMAELTALGLPSVLVPYPYAADDHQTANARELVDAGAALMVPQPHIGSRLTGALSLLLRDHERRARMADAAGRLGKPQAAGEVVGSIERLLQISPTAPREVAINATQLLNDGLADAA
jgi:UDP-N-acetylglucosamine--N-acetylmuramyl-(pentapeptide) pyrophosphoryl-undecaprenol N-acetylglucosamine transferase